MTPKSLYLKTYALLTQTQTTQTHTHTFASILELEFLSAMASPASSASSATSSPAVPGGKCFYCRSLCAQFRTGWKLSNGNYAALCETCGSAYEDGSFCRIFHWDSDGWRFCVTCGSAVHCGCVMSAHAYIMLDVGGIRCLKCLTSATGGSNQRPKLMMSGETTAKKMVPFRMFL
ncbi:B3 domain-containing transcription factor VAL3 [Ricinus communis]|uniref:B3 domain-containing transcription factor VAL3 n=1 Tax=Ricinus communis TaxID=3988 RepID=UPI0007723710|nr:B3 domain-containing transcription factor VAL3 [Ricinus communis]|eukprot:XP_015582005.1 B3 domain-containing transcription factor VAL3 [Ricinus communis]